MEPQTIGIVGGGQLGKMMTIAAKQLGFLVTVVDPTSHSPAGQVADEQIIGGYKDEKATRELAKHSEVITIDAEFVNDEVLAKLETQGKKIHPSPKTVAIIKDKLRQKQFLKNRHIPVAPFMKVSTVSDIEQAINKFGLPLLLKARFDAFDGRGNFVVKNKSDTKKGMEKLKGRSLYIEKYVPFTKELAVMVARSTQGSIVVYPVVETKHVDTICDTVIAPAQIPDHIKKKAETLAKKVVKNLRGAGVFGVEMFLDVRNNVLVNEIAPRVHNSGHYTIESCITSQFEQHIRAITGLPLGKTTMKTKFAVMKNILGKHQGPGFPKGMEKMLTLPNVSVHIYNKKESRPKRKMGHITVVGDDLETCLRLANKARKALVI